MIIDERLLGVVAGEELVPRDDADDEDDAGDDVLPGEVVVAGTLEQGVVGRAVTQAHKELAEANTAPTEAPQLVITQFWAADWITADWELEHWHW